MVPELLFKPELNGKTCMSLQALAWKSICESDLDTRRDLMKNIILSGGTTMYEGIANRLSKEISNLAPAGSEVKIIATSDRKFAVWKGASTLASLSTFEASWITKEEYDDHGVSIVHRKCPWADNNLFLFQKLACVVAADLAIIQPRTRKQTI